MCSVVEKLRTVLFFKCPLGVRECHVMLEMGEEDYEKIRRKLKGRAVLRRVEEVFKVKVVCLKRDVRCDVCGKKIEAGREALIVKNKITENWKIYHFAGFGEADYYDEQDIYEKVCSKVIEKEKSECEWN